MHFNPTKKNEDWHRTTIFHTFIGQQNKICKVIIDSGSCINAISTDAISKLDPTSVDHLNPYKVGWIDASSILIRHRCLVPIKFQSYQENVWCDVMSMDVGSIILGRLWLFDQDAMLHGRSNMSMFTKKGKRITLYPSPLRNVKKNDPLESKEEKQNKSLHLISAKEFERDLRKNSSI